MAFSRGDRGPVKRIAKSHQYFAVSRALRKTTEAVRSHGQAGVVWHTQGSGKSMEMELYANQVLTGPAFGNPTILVLTDRTDLDDQLYGTFDASELLPERPIQAMRAANRDRTGPAPDGDVRRGVVTPGQAREGVRLVPVDQRLRDLVVSSLRRKGGSPSVAISRWRPRG